tara:strand:+ start:1340 stop:2653 length:1314 start_codon:yes stop_codon:yes gene_type:complete
MKKVFENQSLVLNFSCLFIILFPASLIAGPFLSELLMNLTSILITYTILKEKKYYYFKNKVVYLFLFFCLYIFLISFISQDKLLSFKVSLFYFRYGLFVIAFLYILDNTKNFLKIFFYTLLITLAVLIFDGYFQFITGENVFGFSPDRKDRLGGLFFDELILGSFILKMFPLLCIAYYYVGLTNFSKFNYKYINLKTIILFLIVISYALIFFSGERAAFILVNFFIFISSPVIVNKNNLKRFIIALIIFSYSLIVVIANNNKIKDRYVDQFIRHIVSSEENKIIFFPEHAFFFRISKNMFLDSVILGQGPKTFRAVCFKKKFRKNLEEVAKRDFDPSDMYHGCTTHTHNYYLQLLSETGLIGFSFVFIFFLSLFKIYYYSCKQDNKIKILITSGLIVNLWPLTTTGNFFNNWISMTLFLLIALFFYFTENDSFKQKL